MSGTKPTPATTGKKTTGGRKKFSRQKNAPKKYLNEKTGGRGKNGKNHKGLAAGRMSGGTTKRGR